MQLLLGSGHFQPVGDFGIVAFGQASAFVHKVQPVVFILDLGRVGIGDFLGDPVIFRIQARQQLPLFNHGPFSGRDIVDLPGHHEAQPGGFRTFYVSADGNDPGHRLLFDLLGNYENGRGLRRGCVFIAATEHQKKHGA